jgi:protein tyrosine phosphatase (PTP) superfamily phosphohydrolase (DUF442 family)
MTLGRAIVLVTLLPWILGVQSCRNTLCRHEPRPPGWGRPVVDETLDDLVVHRRTEALYHGAQPTADQFKVLHEKLGIRTVVNVRRTHSDEKVVETLGMKYISLPIAAWALKEEHIVEFLRLMRDPAHHPVFVYCWYGGDRSNALAAAYRVVVQGWSKEEAIREMTEGGLHFHPLWQNLVRSIRELDVDKVRRLSGYGAARPVPAPAPWRGGESS